jgi:hypothetical protein
MENQIIVRIENSSLKHSVYIFTDDSNTMPICEQATMDNLLSVITMSAAKYKIKKIKLSGPKSFSLGIKNQLTEKLITCFGKIDDFTIEVM